MPERNLSRDKITRWWMFYTGAPSAGQPGHWAVGTGETWTRAPASLHAIKINEITADSSCREHKMAEGWLTTKQHWRTTFPLQKQAPDTWHIDYCDGKKDKNTMIP